MTVDTAYKFVQFLARKNQTGGIAPKEFEQAFNSAQRDLFNTLLGKITIAPHVALGTSMRITERLKPFKVTGETGTATGQVVPYPAGFEAITLMTDEDTGRALQYIEDSKLPGRLNSKIDPISAANPAIYTNTESGWKLYPATVTTVILNYYKLPTDVVWGYTIVDGRPQYDSTASAQPVWDDLSNESILARACALLGLSFEKQSLLQYSVTSKAEGV